MRGALAASIIESVWIGSIRLMKNADRKNDSEFSAKKTLIGMMAPGLSLVLAAGDRISRIVQPEDFDYYPVRPLGEWEPRPADISSKPPQ